jgi:hypothetical protein
MAGSKGATDDGDGDDCIGGWAGPAWAGTGDAEAVWGGATAGR